MRDPEYKLFPTELNQDSALPEALSQPPARAPAAPDLARAVPEPAPQRATLTILPPISEWDDEVEDTAFALPSELVEAVEETPPARRPLSFLQKMALFCAPIFGPIYDLQMNRRGVRLVKHRVQLKGMPKGAPALRIGFITDLHYGPTSGHVAARQAWKLLHDAKPDLLLLGGDYLYADQRGLPALLREIQRWKWDRPHCGIYAVLGNHDHMLNASALVMTLEACGVTVLRNKAVPLREPWNQIWLAGIDDMHQGEPDMAAIVSDLPAGALSIMLSHSPEVCAESELKRFELTLCGHTHGGQVCLPSGDPFCFLEGWDKQFAWGLHRHAGNWIYVSRGVGTIGLPVRMFAPPDVAIIEIAGSGVGPSR